MKNSGNKSNETFAVIETGGKQYLVKPNSRVRIEKLSASSGEKIEFDKVLLTAKGDAVKIGAPYLDGAKIKAQKIADIRGKKIDIMRYKSKTRRARRQGHRQTYSEVVISDF